MNRKSKGYLFLALSLLLISGGCPAPDTQTRTRQSIPSPRPLPPAPAPEVAPPPQAPAEKEVTPAPEEERSVIVRRFAGSDYPGVVEEFDRFMQRYPAYLKGADDLYYLGMSHYYLENHYKALKALLEYQYRFPGDPRIGEILFVTARIFRALGQEERALDTLVHAERRAADGEIMGRITEERADILAGEGRFLESLSVLDKAYGEGESVTRARLLVKIEELLTVMPLDLLPAAALPGAYSFPHQLTERVRARRSPLPEVRAVEMRPPLPAALPGETVIPEPGVPFESGDRRPVRKIGVVIPLSGRLEAYGREVKRGVDLALEKAAGPEYPYRIEIVEIDEKGEEGPGDVLEKALVHDGPLVLIGPLLSSTVERIIGETGRNGLAVFSPTASSPRLDGVGPNFFRNCLTLESFGEALADLAVRKLGLRKFVILAPEDLYGVRYAEIFEREILERGGTVQAVEHYDAELTDYAGPIRALKRAVGMPDPPAGDTPAPPAEVPFEAVFLPGSAEQAGLIVPQLAFHDIDPRKIAVLGGNNLNTKRFPEVGEEFAEGAIFVDGFFSGSPRPRVQRFVEAYRKAYGEEPGAFSAQAYDAAAIVLEQIRRGVASRRAMLRALAGVQSYPGVTGETTLVPGGLLSRKPFFGIVFNKSLVSLAPQSPLGP